MTLRTQEQIEKNRAYMREYHLKRKDNEDFKLKKAMYSKAYNNRPDIKERRKKYYDRCFFRKTSNAIKFRAKGEPWATKFQLWSLWHKQRGKCALTGRKLSLRTAHLDHIVPVAKGGAHTVENLRWLDGDVNQAKGALADFEFIALCREIHFYNLKKG